MHPLKKIRSLMAVVLAGLCLGLSAAMAADPEGIPAEPPKMVFAHYMVCFRNTVDFYKREIELAQRSGIDGFALNCGAWQFNTKNDTLDADRYVDSVERIYQAAKELNSGFHLFLSPDLATLKRLPENLSDMVERFADHPAQLRYGNKIVLSSYGGSPGIFAPLIQQLKDKGRDIFFVPGLSKAPYPTSWSSRTVRSFLDGQPQMDGVFFFAPDLTTAEYIRSTATAARVADEVGKLFMAGISPSYNSPNLRDFAGFAGYDAKWRGLIQDGIRWVEIVTWNDYNEDSHLMPFHWDAKPLGGRQYFSHDEAFLDATLYYSTWFKTGVRPAIPQDKLYFAYRNRSKDLTAVWNAREQKWDDLTRDGKVVDQIHDDVNDRVYVTAFLTEPASLRVSLGDIEQKFDLPAGVSHVSIPLQPGVPHFRLERSQNLLLAVDGRKSIVGEATPENSSAGYHLANRTWTAGAAVGEALRLPAQAFGEPPAPDHAASVGGKEFAGVNFPVHDLAPGRYNIRIVYRNTGRDDARLTLFALGSADGASQQSPCYFPVSFPPTGEKSGTVSLLWSLNQKVTRLRLVSQPAPPDPAGKTHPWEGDRGIVSLDEMQLIPIKPVTAAKDGGDIPEMIHLPGGNFQMGSATGAPDERPVHEVAVAPFLLGKYEITNAQYEEFDPSHRRLRDEFSWRDSDPVIYVSWKNATDYCNWLSRKMGLAPVYTGPSAEIDAPANGFRLPTEAEWEYAASGRGQGRIYPWGSEPPTADRGNFSGTASLDAELTLQGRETVGTVPVGSYPNGASRDGIMDLAGNVAEWCDDWFRPYSEPGGFIPRYRSIRGGSWGYYNLSQRVADREFNSPAYAGYVYIGFRIVRSVLSSPPSAQEPAPPGNGNWERRK